MEKLIPVINKLQEVFARVNVPFELDLPQIVVVGAQSSGKSSVLESIVGKDFLPRGSGIVTRTPVILQLHRVRPEEEKDLSTQEYAVFAHKPDQVFNDFDAIRTEIELSTSRLAGANKGIADKPIVLKIFSPKVLDLTLVDLPGLTKVPVGEQPKDIEKVIRDLVLKYIQNPKSLILAVSPANIDLANSDSLQLSKEVDPQGNRTVGVITKLDIMDRGTDALRILKGHEIPLKLGYVGVVCRSQEDLKAKKSLEAALRSEKQFFETTAIYSSVRQNCGIEFLARRLNKLLLLHIKNCLPELKRNVDEQLQLRREELKSYGEDMLSEGKDSYNNILLLILSRYSEFYKSAVEGTAQRGSTEEFKVGARINVLFQDVFVPKLASLTPFDELTDEDIRTAILNSKALKPSLFIPEAAFESLMRLQIARLLEPSLSCAQLVHTELRNLAIHAEVPELQRFDRLHSRINEIMTEMLRAYLEPTEQMIKNLIDLEDSYINVNHPDVLTGTTAILEMFSQLESRPVPAAGAPSQGPSPNSKKAEEKKDAKEQKDVKPSKAKQKPQLVAPAVAPMVQLEILEDKPKSKKSQRSREDAQEVMLHALPETIRVQGNPTPREVLELDIIKKLMSSYFQVVVTRVADVVPKTIMAFLVNKSLTKAHDFLVQKVYLEKNIEQLMEENPLLAEKRRNCKHVIQALVDSKRVLDEIRSVEA